jgi:hypothetical protein
MRSTYMQLHAANQDLFTTYNIRNTNHNELQMHLKLLNQHISQAAKLRGAFAYPVRLLFLVQSPQHTRSPSCSPAPFLPFVVGKAQTEFVAACKEAIRGNNMEQLFRLLHATSAAGDA